MSKVIIDLKHKTFWDLFVLFHDKTKKSRAYSYWMCSCSCGVRISVRSDQLRNGKAICCSNCSYKYQEEDYIKKMESLKDHFKRKYCKSGVKVVKHKSPNRDITLDNGEQDAFKKKIISCREDLEMKISDISEYVNAPIEFIRETLREFYRKRRNNLPD